MINEILNAIMLILSGTMMVVYRCKDKTLDAMYWGIFFIASLILIK